METRYSTAVNENPAVAASLETPAFDPGEQTLDPRSVTVGRLSGAIWVAILAAPSLAIMLLVVLFGGLGALQLGTLLLGLGGLGALSLLAFFWPALKYKHTAYRLTDRGLWIRRGVLWRSQISVLKSRIQHTDVSQGPLQRRFGIATLILHTAGTQHAAVALSGLEHGVALRLRDVLIEGGIDDGV